MLDIGASSEPGGNPAAPRVHRQPIQDHRHEDGAPVSLARQLLVLQVIIVILLVAGGAAFVYFDVASDTKDSATEKVVSVARTVADAPTVRDAVGGTDPTATLQPMAERIRLDT